MSPFDFGAILLFIAAAIGFANERWFGLPQPICLLLGAIAVSASILLLDPLTPSHELADAARTALATINFSNVLLDGVLAFLLFAASLQVDLGALRTNKMAILAFSTIGVMIATALFGVLFWLLLQAGPVPVPLPWCFVLGAVLAPTDAVVVEGLLRRIDMPPSLKATISGESLFNDGVGVVIFLVAMKATAGATGLVGHGAIAWQLLVESAGGAAIGVVTGYLAALAMHRTGSETLALTITLALVLATYRLADLAHVSGPIAVVAAGLLVGHERRATVGARRREVLAFWSVVDELLNAMLFLLIGFEMLIIGVERALVPVVLLAIPLALLARAISVGVPITLFGLLTRDRGRAIAVLTWAGLRGGVSIALALALPPSPYRALIVTACYAVIVFSIVVQGLTMPYFVRRLLASI